MRISKTSSSKYARIAIRSLMGLLFVVTGLNGFLMFLPPPSGPMPAGAAALGMALMQSGYLFQLVAGTQLVAGLLLLTNRFVPLALALIAPVIVNIFLVHAFLAPSGLAIASALVAAELFLAWCHRDAFRPMLVSRVRA